MTDKTHTNLTAEEWEAADVPPGFRTLRTFIERGGGVFETGESPPLGFREYQRDDELDWFESDEHAAVAACPRAAFWWCVETGALQPIPIHERPGRCDVPHPTLADRVFAAWFRTQERTRGAKPVSYRVVVSVTGLALYGWLDPDWCPICGTPADEYSPHHTDCPAADEPEPRRVFDCAVHTRVELVGDEIPTNPADLPGAIRDAAADLLLLQGGIDRDAITWTEVHETPDED